MINITHKTSKINFGTTNRLKMNKDGSFIGYHTEMFREDLDWDKFKNYTNSNYNNGANIEIFACSDGSEAYSVALKLNDSRYKISASDFEPESISRANNGLIDLNNKDLHSIEKHTNQKWSDFFIKMPINNQYRIKNYLRNRISFSVIDIRNHFDNYNFKNDTICMIRNVWYHFTNDEKHNILNTLHKNLPVGSTFIIGEQEQLHKPKNFPKLIAELFTPVSNFVNKNGYYLFRK